MKRNPFELDGRTNRDAKAVLTELREKHGVTAVGGQVCLLLVLSITILSMVYSICLLWTRHRQGRHGGAGGAAGTDIAW